MVEASNAEEDARRFLKDTRHPLIGNEKVPEVITVLKKLLEEAEAMIQAYERFLSREKKANQFEEYYKVAVEQASKAKTLLEKLESIEFHSD